MRKTATTWEVKRPLFVCGLIAVAVTAIALKAPIAVTLACVVPLILLLFWKRLRLCAAIALCFLLVAVGYRHTYIRPAEGLSGEMDTLTGQIVTEPTDGRMYTLRVTSSRYLPAGSRVMLHFPDEQLPALYDTVTVRAEMMSIKSNQTYYAARGAFVCAFTTDEDVQITHRDTPDRLFVRWRTALSRVVRAELPSREGGILSALCFGRRDYVSPADLDAFQGSGLSHLLVVSGLHLSMVALAVRRLFRRCGMVPCCLLTLCAVWLFAAVVGFTPSVLRAAMMLSLWLVGCLLFDRSDGLNALGLAAILLLACRPCTLLDVGFQLSFVSTMGVLSMAHLLAPYTAVEETSSRWRRAWISLRISLKNSVIVCISALLFSIPIATYHYGGMPLLSLVSNPLAAFAAGAAMLCGWLGALIGLVPFMGWLANGFLLVAGLLARYMAWVAHLCSPSWSWWCISSTWQWWLLLGVCVMISCAILCRISWRRVAVCLLALVVPAVSIGVAFADTPLRLTAVPVDNEAGFLLQQGEYCALIVSDLSEIDEVVYETPTFEPDVLFILGGESYAISQVTRWPQATVVAAAPADWAVGSDLSLSVCAVGDTVTFWEGCSLTRLSDGWSLLQADGAVLCIGIDPDEPCPYPDGWQIYVGCAPASPSAPYTVVCNASWLRRHASALDGQNTVICDEIVTFTPRRGEWRELPWQ